MINKWAAGINDSLALGILNEAIGVQLPVVASPYAKKVLTAHPAFHRSFDTLQACGVALTPTEALRPSAQGDPFTWQVVTNLLEGAAMELSLDSPAGGTWRTPRYRR